ncbi:MAG TPA: carboxypeptidase-like regulatory domain-containing protein, partial [Bryobacteraceae bacterium]|nr:carboxypeptidase-like regulatory domain-containing protein [Bryobacteraceae bacterium]
GGNIRAGSYFEACGIGPGSYRISAVIPPPEGQEDGLRYASEIFTVGDTTVRLPPLNLQPSFPLSGTVTVSGEKTDDPLPSGLHFSLAPKDRFLNYGENTSAKEDSTGKFTFPAMTADQYWLDIFGIPSGYYVKQARLGVNDILSAPFFAAPGAEIEIVLGSDGPSISGQVTDSDNQPVADATVVLATNPPQSTRADQDGRFTLNGMAPGDYRIAAFRGLQDGLAEDPNFIQANFGRATELTLGPSATVSVNLTAQPTN